MEAQIESWLINNKLNIYLLNAIKDTQLGAQSLSKGRNVGEQFAHIHNVRLMWLKAAEPKLLEGLTKIEKATITHKQLVTDLNLSANAMATLLKIAFENDKLKGFKPHPSAFLSYIIAHEAHHRSQVILCLKQAGQPLDKKILFGLWEWGTK